MKFNMKLLAAALAMAAVGQASAAPITLGSTQGGSSLFLSVWDNTTNESYTRNLGVNLNSFLPNSITTLPNDGNVAGTPVTGNKTPEAGVNIAFAGDALFTSTFGNNDSAQHPVEHRRVRQHRFCCRWSEPGYHHSRWATRHDERRYWSNWAWRHQLPHCRQPSSGFGQFRRGHGPGLCRFRRRRWLG